MHIGGAGLGGAHAEPVIVPTVMANPSISLPALSSLVDDTVGSLLEQLAVGPVSQLIAEIQLSHLPVDATVVTQLLQTAVTAVLAGNAPAAIVALSELIHRSPEHIETLPAESSLAPIRAQMQSLLTRVTSTAKVEAETRLAIATQAVESAKPHGGRPSEWNPKDVLPVAAQLIDSGRHANILLATDLSQAVINYYGAFEIASPRPLYQRGRIASDLHASSPFQAPWIQAVAVAYTNVTKALQKMWGTTPLLILLFIWAALGVISAIAAGIELWSVEMSLEVWGAGSVGLLGFGTYQRLRK